MRLSILITTLLYCLFAATSSHAQNTGIEVQEYLDYLHKQFIESKLGNTAKGTLIHRGKVQVELNVVVRKNKDSEIRSYVIEDDEDINPSAVHKLSFDIDMDNNFMNTSSTPPQEETVETAAEVKPARSPWYKHFFTW